MKYNYFNDFITPQPEEIFVFGSNLQGMHYSGAALTAKDFFGARMQVGEGFQGCSYALPTCSFIAGQRFPLSLSTIEQAVQRFRTFVESEPSMKFFVTKVGCGLAGYKSSDIAPMFRNFPKNCRFDIEWKQFLESPDLAEMQILFKED